VHDDATIAYFGAGGINEVGVLALDLPFILGKPVTAVPAHMDVEADVGAVKDFVADTNLVVLVGHGLTSMGRTISEAYHRLNSFTADVRRAIVDVLGPHLLEADAGVLGVSDTVLGIVGMGRTDHHISESVVVISPRLQRT
jgi:hypothetical protein